MARTNKIRSPHQVSAFVVSLRLPADATLGPLGAAVEIVQRHLGALCAELGGPNLAKRAMITESVAEGLFLVGTPAPKGVAVVWPEMVDVIYEMEPPPPSEKA